MPLRVVPPVVVYTVTGAAVIVSGAFQPAVSVSSTTLLSAAWVVVTTYRDAPPLPLFAAAIAVASSGNV